MIRNPICFMMMLVVVWSSFPMKTSSVMRRWFKIRRRVQSSLGDYYRVLDIETDDEDDEAERVCHDEEDDDTESEVSSLHSRYYDCYDNDSWPQSYKESMDMFTGLTPSQSNFMKGSLFFNSTEKIPQTSDIESSLTSPLMSPMIAENKTVSTSRIPAKLSSTYGINPSIRELPSSQQCSYTQTVLNAMNAMCGIGILSTPYALKEGGWSGLLLLFAFGAITCYTGVLLMRCLERSRIRTYPAIGYAAFGKIGGIFIAIVLYIELYSSCVEYLIMMSDNLSRFFPNAQVDIAGFYLNSYQICAIISTVVILPTVWLRNLKLLSYISVGGVATLILVVICLFWAGVVDTIGFHPSGEALNLGRLPLTIGIYSFCYGCHSVIPNIYSSMKEPSRFPSVLIISFTLATLLYGGVAICAFLMFGEATKTQFTLNLPTEFLASKIAGWTVVVTPLMKFALTITPIALGLEELLPSNLIRSSAVSISIRTSLVVSTLIVALTVPYFGSVMALIGSVLVMLVAIILPCACYMRLNRGSLTKVQIGVFSSIIVAGVISAIIGTYSVFQSAH